MGDRQRRALVVAYYFPPWGGGPVLRTLKLVKYLQPLGWEVHVLTTDSRYYESVSYDPELLEEVGPAVPITRTRSLQPTGAVAQGLLEEAVGGASAGRRSSVFRRLMPFARLLHQLLVPDDKVLWLPYAAPAITRLVRWFRPDVVYVTTPPHSSSLLALIANAFGRVPVVLDIRDDWVGNPLYRRSWRLRTGIEALMERAVLRAASAVLIPSGGSRDALTHRYPDLASRVHLLPNGFDEEDIERARQLPPVHDGCVGVARLECVYTGLITERRNLLALFQAIQRVNAHTPGLIRLRIAGFLPRDATSALMDLGISKDVQQLGYVPHAQALRCVLDADVAILISTASEGARTAVPSKLYEYVACGKPVLGLVDAGSTRDLIEHNDWGLTCQPDDADAIERALVKLLDSKQAGTLGPSPEATARVCAYSRRSLAQAAAAIMEAVIR